MWKDDYKSMSLAQLLAELEAIAKNPHRYDERTERKIYIATELTLRDHKPTRQIIVMEAD
jgi:hypothetical protein